MTATGTELRTWEQAVLWLRSQPHEEALVRACFFDDPLLSAAERYYSSTEWRAVRDLVQPVTGSALDVGSGRGISAFALAKDGWTTTALEPDPSEIVGSMAIRKLAASAGLSIEVIETWGEKLPFPENTFDLVHVRQVLHHARDLRQLCREIARVLKPDGKMIATREHVLSRREDLQQFLLTHPLHHLYGGENAYLLEEYTSAIKEAGIRLVKVLNPLASEINMFPETRDSIKASVARRLRLPAFVHVPDFLLTLRGSMIDDPGRLYTFFGRKT
jgi:ubiquinone/menaquinone biosynthesis C-methylase UbiE